MNLMRKKQLIQIKYSLKGEKCLNFFKLFSWTESLEREVQ